MFEQAHNPLVVEHTQNTNATTWTVDTNKKLPFESHCMSVDAVVLSGDIYKNANVKQFQTPEAKGEIGSDKDQFRLEWGSAVRGEIRAAVRMDR